MVKAYEMARIHKDQIDMPKETIMTYREFKIFINKNRERSKL